MAESAGDRALRALFAPLALLSSRLAPERESDLPGWFWLVRPLLWLWLRLVVLRAHALSWAARLGGLERRIRTHAGLAARDRPR